MTISKETSYFGGRFSKSEDVTPPRTWRFKDEYDNPPRVDEYSVFDGNTLLIKRDVWYSPYPIVLHKDQITRVILPSSNQSIWEKMMGKKECLDWREDPIEVEIFEPAQPVESSGENYFIVPSFTHQE